MNMQICIPDLPRKLARRALKRLPSGLNWSRQVEQEHEARYRKLLSNVENGLVFSRDGDMLWQCRNCGHIHVGKDAPEVCPVCHHEQAYFQLKQENY